MYTYEKVNEYLSDRKVNMDTKAHININGNYILDCKKINPIDALGYGITVN